MGELSTLSEPFRTWWASQDVRLRRNASKLVNHPVVGEIQVAGEALTIRPIPT